jgi:hypothetical protein
MFDRKQVLCTPCGAFTAHDNEVLLNSLQVFLLTDGGRASHRVGAGPLSQLIKRGSAPGLPPPAGYLFGIRNTMNDAKLLLKR